MFSKHGIKLLPVANFKTKKLTKVAKLAAGLIVRSHPKRWMDEEGVQEWLGKVWN